MKTQQNACVVTMLSLSKK